MRPGMPPQIRRARSHHRCRPDRCGRSAEPIFPAPLHPLWPAAPQMRARSAPLRPRPTPRPNLRTGRRPRGLLWKSVGALEPTLPWTALAPRSRKLRCLKPRRPPAWRMPGLRRKQAALHPGQFFSRIAAQPALRLPWRRRAARPPPRPPPPRPPIPSARARSAARPRPAARPHPAVRPRPAGGRPRPLPDRARQAPRPPARTHRLPVSPPQRHQAPRRRAIQIRRVPALRQRRGRVRTRLRQDHRAPPDRRRPPDRASWRAWNCRNSRRLPRIRPGPPRRRRPPRGRRLGRKPRRRRDNRRGRANHRQPRQRSRRELRHPRRFPQQESVPLRPLETRLLAARILSNRVRTLPATRRRSRHHRLRRAGSRRRQ